VIVKDEMLKIAIADDHPGVRLGIRRILERIPEIGIDGEAADGQAAIDLVLKSHPDLLILDIQMPGLDGIQVIQRLQRLGIDIVILVLSGIDDPTYIKEVLNLGACFYIVKGDIQLLIAAVHRAINDECQTSFKAHAY
jgi:DNA-binding NarL/FixJ family response regulator